MCDCLYVRVLNGAVTELFVSLGDAVGGRLQQA